MQLRIEDGLAGENDEEVDDVLLVGLVIDVP